MTMLVRRPGAVLVTLVTLLVALVAVLVGLPVAPAGAAASTTAAPTTAAPSATPSATPSAAPGDPVGDPVGGAALGGRGLVVRLPPRVPAPPAVSAAAYLVADLDTGAVLAAKDPHGRYAPASTIKTLTAITLIPRLPAQQVVTATAANANVDGSKVGVVPGQRYRADELFLALMMVSGNDAAHALASAAGGVPTTVAAMNAEARRLHAFDTVARTPSGLDAPGQATSAYDLALITRAGLQLPAFARYAATRKASFCAPGGRRFEIFTHNRLLLRYPGALGVKNGYTRTARASFIGAAHRGERRLVVTLLRAEPRVWDEAARLLDWGFTAGGQVRPVGRLVDPDPAQAGAVAVRGAVEEAVGETVEGVVGGVGREPGSEAPLVPDRGRLTLFGAVALLGAGLVGLRLRARHRASARLGRHRQTPLPPI